MAIPKKGEPGYDEYREKYNTRRRARFEDPQYRAAEKVKMRERAARRKKERGGEKG